MHRWMLILLLSPALGWGGQVQLRDGRVVEGKVRLAEGGVIVTLEGGERQTLGLDQIERARFADPTPAPAATRPSPTGGLLGEYFADIELRQRLFTRVDPVIRFNWTHDTPHPLLPNAMSARWTGEVVADHSEEYTFITRADDGTRLWVDGRLVIDDWTRHEAADRFGRVKLEAHQRHALKLEYFNHFAQATISLSWESPHTPRQLILGEHLIPARETPSTKPAWPRLRLPMQGFDGGGPVTRTLDGYASARGTHPVIALVEPAEASITRAPAQLRVRAQVAGEVRIAKVRFFADETQLGEVDAPPFEIAWPRPHPGNHTLLAEAVDERGLSGVSDPVEIKVAGDGRGTFPAAWSDQTIRQRERERPTPPAGRASYAQGRFKLQSPPGELLEGEIDTAHFAYLPLAGDGQVTARLARVEAGDVGMGAVAGIMIRDSIRPESRSVSLLVHGDRLVLARRTQLAQPPQLAEKFNVPMQWLRLVRHSAQVRAYASADGRAWTLVAAEPCALAERTLVGLAVCSNHAVSFASAEFDHVQVVPGPPPLDSAVPGVLLRDGVFLAGTVTAIDETSVLYQRDGQARRLALADVARVTFRPVLSEAATAAGERPGVLLTSGDFVEAEVQWLRAGQIRTTDVLFGPREIDIQTQAAAVFLRPVEWGGAQCLFTLEEGSIYPARRFDLEEDELIVETTRQGEMRFKQSDVKELRVRRR